MRKSVWMPWKPENMLPLKLVVRPPLNSAGFLVRTSERTGKPCMLLENCCYGQEEMTVLNMVKKGLFGELIHAEGGYRHDLRDEVCQGRENRHYRLENYMHRNGDVYPTHDLGPIAKYLDINRGNRMVTDRRHRNRVV